MMARNERHHRVVAQRQRDQTLVTHLPAQQRQIGLVVEQPEQRFVGVASFDLHADAGVALTKASNLRQHMHWRIHRENQAAGLQGPGVMQELLRLSLDNEQSLSNAQQPLAQIRQPDRTFVAVEQQHTEALFELAHLVGNRRLREE
jgi:hypothetical protein